MSAATLPSRFERSSGCARIAFKKRSNATVLDRLYQHGCAKIRLPKVHDLACPEAVILNTSGGMTGGDTFDVSCHWSPSTAATVTTQAAERIYRSDQGCAKIVNRLVIGAGATAHWLPQETILFDRGAVERSFEVEIAAGARLVAMESWMIGRHAMGESVDRGTVRDRWRIRRGGELIFADNLRLDGDIQSLLAKPAIARGHRCFATVLIVGGDTEHVRDRLRTILACSAWGGLVVGRMLAETAQALRLQLSAAINILNDIDNTSGLKVPRVWNC